MAEWKKVLVSGSTIDVAALQVGSTAITSTPAELNLLDGVSGLVQADFTKLAAIDSTAAEIDVLDGVTAGTAAASKAVVLDANKDLGTIRDISGSGALFSGTVAANAFLQNMVRIMIGTLIDIAKNEKKMLIEEIINKKDRTFAGKTAPAKGLFFLGPKYKNELNMDTVELDVLNMLKN